MISIVSGPTCVGKTYFIENKKDRILELSNLPPTTESYVTGSFSSIMAATAEAEKMMAEGIKYKAK